MPISCDCLIKALRAYPAVTMANTARTTVAIADRRVAPKNVMGGIYALPA
jgi:hypothetical protein